jgi:hypothetical protein
MLELHHNPEKTEKVLEKENPNDEVLAYLLDY